MSNKNDLTQLKYTFDVTEPLQQVCQELRNNLSDFNACIVTRRGDKLNVRLTYCEGFNLLPADTLIQLVTTAMSSISDITVYSQIPLEMFIVQYSQMINSVTSDICKYLHVPFEDYYQEVCLTLTRLRNEGYYIHKSLLRKAAFNDCCKAFKKDIKHQQYIDENGERQTRQVSIDKFVDAENDTTFADVIEDENAEKQFDDIDRQSEIEYQLKCIKKVCSSREYDQLIRAYRTGTTSNATNSIIRKIKRELGLTL